jgi:hypothetical protein
MVTRLKCSSELVRSGGLAQLATATTGWSPKEGAGWRTARLRNFLSGYGLSVNTRHIRQAHEDVLSLLMEVLDVLSSVPEVEFNGGPKMVVFVN